MSAETRDRLPTSTAAVSVPCPALDRRLRCTLTAQSPLPLSPPQMAPYGYFRVIRFLSDELGVSPEGVQKWRAHWLEEGLQAVEEMLEDPDAICVADSDADCVPPKARLSDA